MVSEAKDLSSGSLWSALEIDPRFFSRDCGIRMTLWWLVEIVV